MDREKIIKIVSIALSAVALVLSIVGNIHVNQVKNSVSFDTSVQVTTATTEEAAVTETENSGSDTETEEGGTEETASTGGSVNIIMRDGVLKLLDSYIRVPAADGSGSGDVCVYLSGENSVRYNSQTNYLVVNSQTVVKAISAMDVTYNGISEFMGSDGTPVLIGEKVISDTAAVAVVYSLEGTSPATEEDVAVVQGILDSARTDISITGLTLFGVDANPDWAEDIVMTEKAAQLVKGNTSIYISPYTGSFAEGTTITLNTKSISLSYSDNIKDTSTGYTPYIYEFSADQNGTVSSASSTTGTLRAKFLSQNNMTLMDVFN